MGGSCSCINDKLDKSEFPIDSGRIRDISNLKIFKLFIL